MGKVLAIIGVILLVWVMYPHWIRGEIIAPTMLPPGTWLSASAPDYYSYPPEGYGWFRVDFWNHPSPYGRTIYQSDFQIW